MTREERAVKLALETQFKRNQPPMPKGRELPVNRDKHVGAIYGKSMRPDNPPRVKGDASGRKIAVKAEGTRSWGSGLGNNVSDTLRGVNGQAERMAERLDRKLGQWRKDRRKIRAKGAPRQIVTVGVTQTPVRLPGQPAPKVEPRYVTLPTPAERAAAAKVESSWGKVCEQTFKAFGGRW